MKAAASKSRAASAQAEVTQEKDAATQAREAIKAAARLDHVLAAAAQDVPLAGGVETQPPAADTAGRTPRKSPKEDYEQALAALAPQIQKATQTGGDQLKAIKATLAGAKGHAGDDEYDEALAALDDLELLLVESRPPSNVAFQKMRLRWLDGKNRVASQIADLQQALLSEFNNEEAAAGAKKLDQILAAFDAGLADTLDDFINAAVGDQRAGLKDKALGTIGHYLEFVETAPLIDHIQANPFVPVSIRASLTQPLLLLQRELQKGGA